MVQKGLDFCELDVETISIKDNVGRKKYWYSYLVSYDAMVPIRLVNNQVFDPQNVQTYLSDHFFKPSCYLCRFNSYLLG